VPDPLLDYVHQSMAIRTSAWSVGVNPVAAGMYIRLLVRLDGDLLA